ncbi:MAG: Rieske 2Fe-2S domain-containing protein [Dehalococcoidia bacterium]|nr:Rieske 2Fe-2S domain-containing protein [Dehalococcoidia bacterium]
MTTTTGRTATGGFVRVSTLEDLERSQPKVVAAGGRTIVLFVVDGQVYALDNRCPHMGFPLSKGTVRDGILTCHWHHARFDLAGGCTFDPFADDVPHFRAEVRDGDVWLDPRPVERDRRGHWLHKLDEGLEQNIRLVLAKSVIGLSELDETSPLLERAALFGTRNRASGWSAGLSILTAMGNVQPHLDAGDRPRALYHGLVHVARDTEGQPPDFDLEPLATTETRPEVYRAWFRRFIETRSAEPAERCLRTAIRVGLTAPQVADMLFAAATDHLFLGEGHALDFANKAFELLDLIGWEHAEDVLPSLIGPMVRAERMEETSAWQHPVDLPTLLAQTFAELDTIIEGAPSPPEGWQGHRELAETILDAEPDVSLRAMLDAARAGVPLVELAATVAYAAARRPVHFHVSNEFGDWDTIHHTFTYTNAVDQAMRRAPSSELSRAIFDGAMSVYLERFLNVPKQPIPRPAAPPPERAQVLDAFDRQQQVDETAQLVADQLAGGRHSEVLATLGHALLREDAGFHQFQIYEAAVCQYGNFAGRPEGDHVLIGAARFLTAHAPTVRSVEQTYDIAARLHRGEALYGEEEAAEPV